MKLRFGLISLFVLTAIIAVTSSWHVSRQKIREAELSKFEGKWQEVESSDGVERSRIYTFTHPGRELLRPGVFKYTEPTGEVSYGIYEWYGKQLLIHRTDSWYECPKGFDDMLPEVSWDAPPDALYDLHDAKRTRVHRRILRRIQ